MRAGGYQLGVPRLAAGAGSVLGAGGQGVGCRQITEALPGEGQGTRNAPLPCPLPPEEGSSPGFGAGKGVHQPQCECPGGFCCPQPLGNQAGVAGTGLEAWLWDTLKFWSVSLVPCFGSVQSKAPLRSSQKAQGGQASVCLHWQGAVGPRSPVPATAQKEVNEGPAQTCPAAPQLAVELTPRGPGPTPHCLVPAAGSRETAVWTSLAASTTVWTRTLRGETTTWIWPG